MFFYEEVLREFHEQGVKYVLVGGFAVNLLGSMRSTADLDILVEMTDSNLVKIVNILIRQGYRVKQPVNPMDLAVADIRKDWIENKHIKAFNFYKENEFKEVDIIIESPVCFEDAQKDQVIFRVADLSLPVISINQLIKMKEHTGRTVDQLDIEELRKIQKIRGKL